MSLREKNKQYFTAALGASRLKNYDPEYVQGRQISIEKSQKYSFQSWLKEEDKVLLCQDMIPRSSQIYDKYHAMMSRYSDSDGIEQYINDDENDPHLLNILCKFQNIVSELGQDSQLSTTTSSFCDLLIVLDPWDGQCLASILQIVKPKALFICLERWEDLESSFDCIDWQQITEQYSADDKKMLLSCCKSYEEIAINVGNYSLLSLDHAFYLAPNINDNLSKHNQKIKSKFAAQEPAMIVNYLGFAMDEFNMIYSSAKTLAKGSKIYSPNYKSPNCFENAKFVVTGSGPSLDHLMPVIRKLQDSHYVVASASSYGPLLRSGIKVDFLVILERGYDIFDDYAEVHQQFGSQETIVIRASVADSRFAQLTGRDVVYFRASLTPYGIFSPSPGSALPFDSPQAINAGVSFAANFYPAEVVLAGIDLGSPTTGDGRAQGALGPSDRNFTVPQKGNLRERVYTEQRLLDAKVQVEKLMSGVKAQSDNKTNFFNISDGILLDGADPVSLEDDQINIFNSQPQKNKQLIDDWYQALNYFSSKDFNAAWSSARPRECIYKTFRMFKSILDEDLIVKAGPKIAEMMKTFNYRYNQFAWKAARGVFVKSMLSIRRQIIVFQSNNVSPEIIEDFEKKAKVYLGDRLDKLEAELYELCDIVDSL